MTPEGLFQTTRERPEGWWEGDLGKIYRPKYFVGGIAIHGMTSVPNHPASHGCVRLSTAADGLHLGSEPDPAAHHRVGAQLELEVAGRRCQPTNWRR